MHCDPAIGKRRASENLEGQSEVRGQALSGIARAVTSAVPSLDLMVNLSHLAGGALHKAPMAWHVAIAVSFVAINTILFLLLRRAPKGIDV